MDWIQIKNKLIQHRNKMWWLIILVMVAIFYYLLFIKNPLPTDEVLIAQFQAHRADFEELVHRYRHFDPGPNKSHNLWVKQENTSVILKRARIRRIYHSAFRPWMPDPYSIETARVLDNELRNSKNTLIFFRDGALILKPEPRKKFNAFNLRYVNIWKDFFFVPVPPRIEDGEMLGPVRSNGEYSFRSRILSSLDHFPKQWKDFECVFRLVEPQWFLRMCNGQ